MGVFTLAALMVAGAAAYPTGYTGTDGCTAQPIGPHSGGSSSGAFDIKLYSDSSCSTELTNGYDGESTADVYICVARTDGSSTMRGLWMFAYPAGSSPTTTNVESSFVGSLLAGTGSSGM